MSVLDGNLKCPKCSGKTCVKDSRPTSAEGRSIRRRRVCVNCEMRFTTYEVAVVEGVAPATIKGLVEDSVAAFGAARQALDEADRRLKSFANIYRAIGSRTL